MTTCEFFESVYNGKLFESDIRHYVKTVTDNYQPDKFYTFCDDFDLFLAITRKELEDGISEDELKSLDKSEIIYLNEFEERTFFIRGFYQDSDISHLWLKNKNLYCLDLIASNKILNIERLFYPSKLALLEWLKRHLIDILFDEFSSSKKKLVVQPIIWLKNESLSQFIEELKSAGLIDDRDTMEIIQEHFRQTDKLPQPIKWNKSNRLIIYLFSKLSETGLIDTIGRPHQLITEHFLDKKGQPFKAENLKSDFYNMKNYYTSDPRGSNIIDRIISKLTD